MRYQLFVTICLSALVSASASAYAADSGDGVAVQAGDSVVGLVEQPQNTAVQPRLPIARDGEVIDSVGGGATEAVLPVTQASNGVSYITGGIGDEEEAEIKAQENNFNTHVLLIAANGEYMGEVAIRFLAKDNSEVLRVDNVGPFFYSELPAGEYTVEAASSSGELKSAKIKVPAKNPKMRTVIRFSE